MKRQLQGIGLILFGILLGACGDNINSTILSSMSDAPFGFIGVCAGIAGLVLLFRREKDSQCALEEGTDNE